MIAIPAVSGRRLLAGLGIGVALAAVLGIASWAITASIAPDAVGGVTFTVAVVALAYASVLAGLVVAQGGARRFLAVAGYRAPSPAELLSGAAGWFVWAVVVAVVYLTWGLLAGDPLGVLREILADVTDVARLPGATWLALLLIAVRVLFLAGTLEESLFRGLLQPWLQRRLPVAIAIGITAAAFMVLHIYPVAYPAGAAFGIIAGILRVRSSTTATFAMHVLADVSTLAAAILLNA